MPTRTVEIETILPTSADRVWGAMQHPGTFLYVTRGLLGFPALAGRTEVLQAGESGSGLVWAFHIIPAYRHTIEVLEVDADSHTIRTHEHGGLLERWDHTLHVEPIDDRHCRYRDTIIIDAGRQTAVAALVAKGIFRYRQHRWHRLVRNHLMPEGPRYATASSAATTFDSVHDPVPE